MSADRSAPTALGGVALLERATSYTLGSLRIVRRETMGWPTPCPRWDLRMLLAHMNDSLAALAEAADLGDVSLEPSVAFEVDLPRIDEVGALRQRACRMLGAWTRELDSEESTVGGCPVPSSLLARAGAIEVAVHGWDVARACGSDRVLPERLAEDLWDCAQQLVIPADRPDRFALPVDVSPWASTSDRLLGFLGRRP